MPLTFYVRAICLNLSDFVGLTFTPDLYKCGVDIVGK